MGGGTVGVRTAVLKHPVLQGIDRGLLAQFQDSVSSVHLDAGQTVFRAEEDAKYVYLILSGQVAIQLYVPGRGAVTVQTVGAGEVLGYSWFLGAQRWHFDAVALEETWAAAVDADDIRRKCEADHDFGYEIAKRVVGVIAGAVEATRWQLLDVYGKADQ